VLLHSGNAALRPVVAPGAVAAFAAFELWHAGAIAAVGIGWPVFVLCVFAVAAWATLHLERTRRRLGPLRAERARRRQ
jgi:hypothetical protein